MRSMVEGAAPVLVTSRVLTLTTDVGSAPSVTAEFILGPANAGPGGVTAPRQAGSIR